MDIRFEIEGSKITFGDMMAIEDAQEGKRPFNTIGGIMANHMVDEAGNYLEWSEALAILRKLSLSQTNEVIDAFMGAIQRKAIPPKRSAS